MQNIILTGDKHRDTAHSKECVECGSVFYRDKRCTWVHWHRAKFCSRNCSGSNAGKAQVDARLPIKEHFYQWVEKKDGCWKWQGGMKDNGYGLHCYGKSQKGAHVRALEIEGHKIPKGMCVCHKCNNRSCVNPDHLYVGTYKQNSADQLRAGNRLQGETHYNAKLSEKDVKKIRSSKQGLLTLAEKYNVTDGAIRAVINRKTWKHVQ